MNRTLRYLMLALAVASGACRSKSPQADTTLAADLSLAAQQQRDSIRLDSLERARAATSAALAPTSTRPVVHRASSGGEVVRHHSSGGTVTTSSSSSGGTVVKHTNRDAAIGAAAGAIIGATTSRSKVKGGLIGAAVGGILGGVIGNNVDKTKKKP